MRRSLLISVVSLFAIATPLAALAQTSSNTSVSALMSELAALEQQIQSYTGSSATSSPTATMPSNTLTAPASATPQGLCPDLGRTLSLGSTGADVSGLQSFLGEEGLFKGIATGYYGNLTAAAVGDWQIQNGILTGGDAASTGFGVVGPRTRTAMESSCLPNQSASSKQCIPVFPPTTECPSNWQPVADSNGCTAYYECTVNLPQLSSVPSTSSATEVAATTTCPYVQHPTCSTGSAEPFQVTANGCVLSYQCSI